MPKALIADMKRGYAGKGLSQDEIDHRVYGHLNNEGLMHGSQETAKGQAVEAKFEADHGAGVKKKAASWHKAKKFLGLR